MLHTRPPKDVDRLLFQRESDSFGMTDFFHYIADPRTGIFRPAHMQPYINRRARPEAMSPAKLCVCVLARPLFRLPVHFMLVPLFKLPVNFTTTPFHLGLKWTFSSPV